ncbi:MAG: hypothetical protein HRT60_09750 [Dinoroseobacter sp.]|nr:hypothetical protein [Dinoroseobacter sp.]
MIHHASPLSIAAILALSLSAFADEGHDHPSAAAMDDAVTSATDAAINAPFDIVAAHVHREGRTATFHMTLAGDAGSETPEPTGALGGAPVLSYVWPTSLDPSAVGFEGGTGILALAATSHPDFDDTPLFDENGDGNLTNDGAEWHSHWVVLTPTEACGEGALGVRDVAEGETPDMPATWPGLPIFIDSPGFTPVFNGPEVIINVGFSDAAALDGASYDGVTSALRVSANIHAPLLCVEDVFDIASGDLSLPGRVE